MHSWSQMKLQGKWQVEKLHFGVVCLHLFWKQWHSMVQFVESLLLLAPRSTQK